MSEIGCEFHTLVVRVENTMQPSRRSNGASTTGDGSGLVGMAERANVLGGTFQAVAVDGAFIVNATLPTNPPRNDPDAEVSP